MTQWQASSMTSAGWATDPYRCPGAVDHDDFAAVTYGMFGPDDSYSAAPDPGQRVNLPLRPSDRKRLDLHATLTTAGIAPLPGDLAAIDALCSLDDTTHAALQRWINHAR